MGAGLAGSAALTCGAVRAEPDALKKKALIAITLDLEMSRNFPSWEDTHCTMPIPTWPCVRETPRRGAGLTSTLGHDGT